MATLGADKPRIYKLTGAHPDYNSLPMIAADIIYAGAAVGESSTSGTYRPLAGGDTFAGFAVEKADNASGAASAVNVKVLASGIAVLTVTGVDNANDIDATVYASDDDTFTLTNTSTNSAIGKVRRVISTSAGTCEVFFQGVSSRSL